MKMHQTRIIGRRSFLKVAGVAAGAALATGCEAPLVAPVINAKVQTVSQSGDKAKAGGMDMPNNMSQAQPTSVKPHATYDATVRAADKSSVKQVAWSFNDATVYIAKDVAYSAWTFDGTIPGPLMVVNEGDEVQFTITNKGSTAHSADFHAAQTPPNKNYVPVAPQATHQLTWKANYPGNFMYHCGTPYVLQHMATGMYGMTIVKPKSGLQPADREYALVQSEYYLTSPAGGVAQTDLQKALNGSPDYVVFNGYADQYRAAPLTAKVGELIRLWVVNAGPSHFSAFHVIGAIFDAVYQSGNPANKMVWVQTANIYPGSGIMVELRIPEAGDYAFVTHSFADASKGALGVLAVTNS